MSVPAARRSATILASGAAQVAGPAALRRPARSSPPAPSQTVKRPGNQHDLVWQRQTILNGGLGVSNTECAGLVAQQVSSSPAQRARRPQSWEAGGLVEISGLLSSFSGPTLFLFRLRAPPAGLVHFERRLRHRCRAICQQHHDRQGGRHPRNSSAWAELDGVTNSSDAAPRLEIGSGYLFSGPSAASSSSSGVHARTFDHPARHLR